MTRRAAAFSVGVVCEAAADHRVATGLAERVLAAEVEWIEPETLPHLCRWCGLDVASDHLPWPSVLQEAKRRSIRAFGGFRGGVGVFDQHRARLAKRLFMTLDEPPEALLLVRDTDDEDGRAASLEQLRGAGDPKPRLLLALPHPKLECWILAGFDPGSETEEARLRRERTRLGFDPRQKAERLTAEGKKGKLNAKKTLVNLSGGDSEREARCWSETELGTLHERGRQTGLAAYLDEVRGVLVPLVAGRSA